MSAAPTSRVRPYVRRISAWLACATLALAACNDNSTNPSGAIDVAASGVPASIAQGQSGAVTVSVTRTAPFADVVNLSLEGVPAGLVAAFNPAQLPSAVSTSTLTLSPDATVAPGSYTLTIRASGTGVNTATTQITVVVAAASVPSISVLVNPTTLSVAQSASATSVATVTRGGGFAGDVTLAVSGMPTGVTATAVPNPVTAGTTTSTVTIAVAATTPTGTYPLTVTASASGVTSQTATISLTVTVPQPFSITLNPAAVSVQQGASATSTATITRNGTFTDAVALAVTGAPNGLGVTVNPASVTGTTSTITVSPSAAVAPGVYTLTVTGTATGVTAQTAALAVTVTAATSTTSAAFTFCADNVPLWLAVQDGTGGWVQVQPGTNNTFSFQLASSRGGVAYVTSNANSGTSLVVLFATAAELAGGSGSTSIPCTQGGKTINGSVASIGATDIATVTLGSSLATVAGATGVNTFQLKNVTQGAHDLVASRSAQSISGTTVSFVANSLIIRRGLDPADGSTLPVLDFNGTEAFAPAAANVTINNLGTDQAIAGTSLVTANGTSAAFSFSGLSTLTTQPFYGVPDARLVAGDLHSLFVSASPQNDATQSRSAILFFRSVTDRTVTLGASLVAPTFSTVATTPYLRLRAQLAQQGEYNRLGGVSYGQGTGATARSASVFMTAGYAAGAPFDLIIPDFTGVSGWNNVWGLQPAVSTTWNVVETGGSFGFGFPGQSPTDGAAVLTASRSGTIASP